MPKRKILESTTVPATPTKRSKRTAASSSILQNDLEKSPSKRRRNTTVKNATEPNLDVETPKTRRIRNKPAEKVDENALLKEGIMKRIDATILEDDELNIVPGINSFEQDLLDPYETPKKKRGRKKKVTTEDGGLDLRTQATAAQRESSPSPSKRRVVTKKSTPSAGIQPSKPKSPTKCSQPKGSNVSIELTNVLPTHLPNHLHGCLEIQKLAILNAIDSPPLLEDKVSEKEPHVNTTTLQQLSDLLSGSIEREEGNSCLIIGPAGSGKTKIMNMALEKFKDEYRPIVIRLDGQVQYTDRLAMREISRQVIEQTGSKSFGNIDPEDDEDNPFDNYQENVSLALPPSHLPSLIANLPALSRPVVVILDAFNIFTEQPRQALLYCLLDTVQACRSGMGQHGLAVIGLTSRVDVVNLLEKRVKSRFSHRMFRTASMHNVDDWISILERCFHASEGTYSLPDEWISLWKRSVKVFLDDRLVKETLRDRFGISRDIRSLLRIFTNIVVHLTPSSPFLTQDMLKDGAKSQFASSRAARLMKLKYPSLALLIAAQHARTAGHDSFTFEMLYDAFVTQVRTSSAAPVMLGGGGIGMANVGRRVMAGALEELVRMDIFSMASLASVGLSKDFIRYRSTVEREDVKLTIERVGQTSLKKWFGKAQ